MSLLEYNTIKKRQIDKFLSKIDEGDSKEYKVETIWDSDIYARKLEGNLSGLHYLVF